MSVSSSVPEFSRLPESLQFLQLIWTFAAGLDQTSEKMAAKSGVTARQRFILRVVGLTAGVTTEQLAALLAVDATDLERDLQALVAKSVVATRNHNSTLAYHLTPAGAVINSASAGTVEQAVSKALDESTAFERAAFRRMLERTSVYLNAPR